jgi:DNA-directed RNA polymerase subunit M/transcription elongation factor TFIIS
VNIFTIIFIGKENILKANKLFRFLLSKSKIETDKFSENSFPMEIGESLNLQEIENTLSRFKECPKCDSKEGFWLGVKRDRTYVQCKSCGANFELFELFAIGEERETPKLLRFFRK